MNREDISRNRKYTLAMISLLVSSVALFWGILPPSQFVAVVTLVLGIYNTANVVQKKQQ